MEHVLARSYDGVGRCLADDEGRRAVTLGPTDEEIVRRIQANRDARRAADIAIDELALQHGDHAPLGGGPIDDLLFRRRRADTAVANELAEREGIATQALDERRGRRDAPRIAPTEHGALRRAVAVDDFGRRVFPFLVEDDGQRGGRDATEDALSPVTNLDEPRFALR